MKTKLLFAVIFFVACFGNKDASAQLRININIGSQPVWGPVGYDYVQNYYIPDIDAYYYVDRHQYVYMDRGRWIFSASLPPQYRNYDIYHGYKVVVNEPQPWMHNDRYRAQYANYRGRHDQQIIRESHDERYFANPQHPQHGAWQSRHQGRDDKGNQGHGNGRKEGLGEGHQQGEGRGGDRGHDEGHGHNDHR